MEAEISVEKVSVEDYLAAERKSEIKHEYIDGTLFPMSGASYFHTIICGNIIRILGNLILKKELTIHGSDLRVAAAEGRKYYYPDVVLIDGEPVFTDPHSDTITNPSIIFEVLFKSTEGYDRGDKFQSYRMLESLQAYVLVAQDKPLVEVFTRNADTRQWVLSEARGTESSIQLPLLDADLALADLYAKVKFPVR
ncbi:MAG: Uma2 family endonuclease [Cyclobacteriaceae bacterium]